MILSFKKECLSGERAAQSAEEKQSELSEAITSGRKVTFTKHMKRQKDNFAQ